MSEQGFRPQTVTLTPEQLAQVVREARAPYVDPEKERREATMRAAREAEEREALELKRRRQRQCNHMRDQGRDSKSCVQIAVHTGGVAQLYCPRCGLSIDQSHPDFARIAAYPNHNVPAIAGLL